jgi:hypothetical protein
LSTTHKTIVRGALKCFRIPAGTQLFRASLKMENTSVQVGASHRAVEPFTINPPGAG